MYKLMIILLLSCQSLAFAQQMKYDECNMSVSPIVDQNDNVNKIIIRDLCKFLMSKNDDIVANEYWDSNDFHTYKYPYIDLYNIEQSKYGKDFYKPTLMEVLPTSNAQQKIVKIAFIGHDESTKVNQIKCIYNVMANVHNDKAVFSRYLTYATSAWTKIDTASLHYCISAQRQKYDVQEIQNQLQDVNRLSRFFDIKPIDITYYSCINALELFQIKGFDYTHSMYLDTKGGLADYGDMVFSANNAEYYTHEVAHIYTNKICNQPNKFIDEGIAMCFGGSGLHDYEWHKNQFKKFIESNPDFNMAEHLDIYERAYVENETPIPYMIAALVCQRTLRLYDKNKLIDLLKSNESTDVTIAKIGLTMQNIHQSLSDELNIKDFKIYNH